MEQIFVRQNLSINNNFYNRFFKKSSVRSLSLVFARIRSFSYTTPPNPSAGSPTETMLRLLLPKHH